MTFPELRARSIKLMSGLCTHSMQYIHALCSNDNRRHVSEGEPPLNLKTKWIVPDSKTDHFLADQSDGNCSEYQYAEINDSSTSTIRIVVGSDSERNSTWTRQCNNARSRCRGTRTMLYTPVSCETGHSVGGTSIKREHLLELCFGQGQREIHQV